MKEGTRGQVPEEDNQGGVCLLGPGDWCRTKEKSMARKLDVGGGDMLSSSTNSNSLPIPSYTTLLYMHFPSIAGDRYTDIKVGLILQCSHK